jgi:putative mycofactocin binding protein MftB
VSLRAEPFGALAYHHESRHLSFLKSRALAEIVEDLGRHPSAFEALRAAGIREGDFPIYEQALRTLARTGMIRPGGGT